MGCLTWSYQHFLASGRRTSERLPQLQLLLWLLKGRSAPSEVFWALGQLDAMDTRDKIVVHRCLDVNELLQDSRLHTTPSP